MATLRRVTLQSSESIDSREIYLEKLDKMLKERPIKTAEINDLHAERDDIIVG